MKRKTLIAETRRNAEKRQREWNRIEDEDEEEDELRFAIDAACCGWPPTQPRSAVEIWSKDSYQ